MDTKSLRTAAIVAGLGLLIMAILAPIAEFGILPNLIVPGDGQATAENIRASIGSFRVGIVLYLVVAILDVIVAWGLYSLLQPVNESLSLLAAWFRMVYAAIFVATQNNLSSVLSLLTERDTATQVHAQVMTSLNAFQSGWDLAIAVFSLHLVVLGYLVFRSDYFPRWLGFLVVVAGLGYLVDSFGAFLIPNYGLNIAAFTFFGEPLLIIWLLWRGVKGFDGALATEVE